MSSQFSQNDQELSIGIESLHRIFRSRLALCAYSVKINDYQGDTPFLFDILSAELKELVAEKLNELGSVKIQLTLFSEWYSRELHTLKTFNFNSNISAIYSVYDVPEIFEDLASNLMRQEENLTKRGSGWIFIRVVNLEIQFLQQKIQQQAGPPSPSLFNEEQVLSLSPPIRNVTYFRRQLYLLL